MTHDFFRGDAFAYQALAHGVGIRDDAMGHAKRQAFGASLPCSAKVGFALECDSRRRSRHRGSRHAKDVRVKTVRMDDVNFVVPQVTTKPLQLANEIRIVKTGQRIFNDFT
jgi:hypothetical protein